MDDATGALDRYKPLADDLESLASDVRLALLSALRMPKSLHEIRVPASVSRRGERPERLLARQTVTHHLEQLERKLLISRVALPEKPQGEAYVLNHRRLFAMIDELRALARLRPILPDPVPDGRTMERRPVPPPGLPDPPRIVVAYGRDDGVAFGLKGRDGSVWRIGRGAPCEISLDYDPYLSSVNTLIEQSKSQFVVLDAGSRNGTWVNWSQLREDERRTLRSGDVLLAGRSILVFQT